jgi:hypothetical protein
MGGIHYVCSGVQKSSYLAKSKDLKLKWRCVPCKEKLKLTPPPPQPQPTPTPFNFTSLEVWKNEIREEVKKEVRDGLNAIKAELLGEIIELKTSVNSLSATVSQNVIAISELSDRLNRLEQYGRNRNVEIENVELLDGEKVEDIVVKVAGCINIELSPKDIEAAHRLPARKTSTAPPRIIVQFSSRKKRDEFIAARSQVAPITSQRLVGGKSSDRIYVNENLTRYYSELLWRAKQKGKAEGYKFVWYKYGKVLAKKSETSQSVIRISTPSDIDKIV